MSSQKELIKNLNEILNQKDEMLTPENIRAGVTILGVEGSSEVVDTSDATAEGYDILKGKVAYTKGYRVTGMYEPLDTSDATAGPEHITNGKTAYVNGEKITGNIPTNGNLYYTPNTEDQEIPAGYTEGGTVWGDSDLLPKNIKKGVTIFNTEGEYTGEIDTSDATAVASQILEGQTAYVKEIKITGTMPNKGNLSVTPSTSNKYYSNGYYSSINVSGDSNLVSQNIKAGTSIFGVEGELDIALDTADANATADDIKKDKTAYVAGNKITGTHECIDTSDATANASEILKGKTAYVNDQKITGTMSNTVLYEATVNKETDRIDTVNSYIHQVKTPSVLTSVRTYTTPVVYDSQCQGGIQGLTTLTGLITSLKNCRVIAVVCARDTITVSEGWELLDSFVCTDSDIYQTTYIYSRLADSIETAFTVTCTTPGRLFLTLLSFDLENDIEMILKQEDLPEATSYQITEVLYKGDLIIHHHALSTDTDGSTIKGSSTGNVTKYATPDATERMTVYYVNSNHTSLTINLAVKQAAIYSYMIIRFKGSQPLVPENIRKGIKVMDFVGTFEGEFDHSDATVTENDLLEGVKAYNVNGELLTGTIPNNGELDYTPSEILYKIPEGYTSGGTVKAVDITSLKEYQACLTIANSVDNLDDYSNTTATAEDIREGKTAYSNGELLEGTLKSR